MVVSMGQVAVGDVRCVGDGSLEGCQIDRLKKHVRISGHLTAPLGMLTSLFVASSLRRILSLKKGSAFGSGLCDLHSFSSFVVYERCPALFRSS